MAQKSNFLTKVKAFYSNHPIISGLLLMAFAGIIIVWICLIFLNFWTRHGDDAIVPEIKHLPYTEAEQTLSQCNLTIEISDSIYDPSVAPGTVVESWPKAGSVVKSGRNVYVTITAFSPKQVTISRPVTGVSVRQAVSYLNALGISSIRFVEIPSEYPDLVESARCDNRPIGVGSMLPVDATVVLEVGIAVEPELSDSIPAEEAIFIDLSSQSTYVE